MTDSTRFDILAALRAKHHSCECGDYCEWCAPWACAASDSTIMASYLDPWSSQHGYEAESQHRPEFYAVLATAEYHQHWKERENASTSLR